VRNQIALPECQYLVSSYLGLLSLLSMSITSSKAHSFESHIARYLIYLSDTIYLIRNISIDMVLSKRIRDQYP
jgi:hypothetical protein